MRSLASAPRGTAAVMPEILSKARRMSPPVGFAAGIFGSLVGVGGGVVIVPTIVSACKNIPQRLVSGTSLAAVLSTAAASAATFAQSGYVDVAAALVVSPVAMLTAPFGAKLTARLNCASLRRILGYFLICVAPLVPLKAYLLSSNNKKEEESAVSAVRIAVPLAVLNPVILSDGTDAAIGSDSDGTAAVPFSFEAFIQKQRDAISAMGPKTVAVLAATGGVAGLASGLLGIGGGTIVTPLLALCLPYSQATVLGTSLLSMVPPSAAALAQHARMGNVDWRMAAGLALGTGIGGAVGSLVAIQAPSGVLEACFAVGMFFLGRKTLLTAR